MKKKLIDLLQESKYQKVNVKIGSHSGSSFWYCGKGNISYSIPNIKGARKSMLLQVQRGLASAEYRLNHLDEIYEQTIEKAEKNDKRPIKDIKAYIERMMIKKESERKRLPKKIQDLRYCVETGLLDRPVKEVREGISPDEQPCYVIYVKGVEKGPYWTIAEYNKRRKRNENKENKITD